jgi:protein-tyrosine-phosphatase
MMAALLQAHLGGGYRVDSAGLSKEPAGRSANHRSVTCLKERGVDLSRHVSRWVGDVDLSQYAWIVTVGEDEAAKVRSALARPGANVIVANAARGGVPDPYELGMQGYRDCLALLDEVLPPIARQIQTGRCATGQRG